MWRTSSTLMIGAGLLMVAVETTADAEELLADPMASRQFWPMMSAQIA